MSDDNPLGSASSGSAPKKQDASDLKREVSEEDRTQLNVEIPESLHKELKIESIETGQEMREITADALRKYLDT
jgi:predicted GNAT superfamily acetyltransferase